MKIFPAIDLSGGKVVRLFKGDYNKMTVYGDAPSETAKEFENAGAEFLHVVDLDGAKDASTANFETVKKIVSNTSLAVEIGGGIRNEDVIKKYLDCGVSRVILGTIAVTDPDFTKEMIKKYGEKIAIGADLKDGFVATHGWLQVSGIDGFDFCSQLCEWGVKTVICTDISKDGAGKGTNLELYRKLSESFDIDIVASGGVSGYDDIEKLREMNIFGAIVGKALYTGDIDLKKAITIAERGIL